MQLGLISCLPFLRPVVLEPESFWDIIRCWMQELVGMLRKGALWLQAGMWQDLCGGLVEKVVLVVGGDRARTAASRRSVGGVMPARIRSWLTGVAHRQPETVRKVVLSVVSSFLVWELLHQTGEQYSVPEKTNAWVEVRRVLVKAPQVVPARWRIRATRADV